MSAGLSALSDYAGIGGHRAGIQAGDHRGGRPQRSALFADVRQHAIRDRGAGNYGDQQGGGFHRRRERKTECVHGKRSRLSRARGLPDRSCIEVNALAQERALGGWLANGLRFVGQIAIESDGDQAFALRHREDAGRTDLVISQRADDAAELARFDDAGNYRPLKTAPTLRHGWKLSLPDLAELRLALDHFYPGRLAAFLAFEQDQLATTPFRETLDRQSGMYRIAAQIGEEQADDLVGNFCRSDGGCLRTILWRRDKLGTLPSAKLPPEKFDPKHDQTGARGPVIPLLCQEACNLLVAEARRVVQA